MYHIGNDKRQISSAKCICDSLENLLEKYEYHKITISQIVIGAGIGRATFYRLFDDKSDVIIYQMENVFTSLVNKGSPENLNSLLFQLFELWLSKKKLLLNLIKANLYENFLEKLSTLMENKLSFIQDSLNIDNRSWKYFIAIRSSMIFAALRVAITKYPNDKPGEIIKTINLLFSNQSNIINSHIIDKKS